MFAENQNYEILTPSGWQDFRGITETENKELVRITLKNNCSVDATLNHYFFKENQKVQVSALIVGDSIDTVDGAVEIVKIEPIGAGLVYDIIEVADPNHLFIVNDLIITKNCDEFSYVRPSIAREFWVSISPTLSTGGKALITSTPNSDEDQFAQIWKQANRCTDEWGNTTPVGTNGFKAFRSYWHEHPERDDQWKREEMGRIGEERFRREHDCDFVTADETLINSVKLLEMQGSEPTERQGQVRWYQKPKTDRLYLVALDPSLGTGGDMSAIEVFEVPTMIQIAEWQHNRTPIQKQIQVLKEIVKQCSDFAGATNVYYSVENNTLGEAALVSISEIGEENIAGVFLSEPASLGHARRHRKGFTTTSKSKLAACAKLKSLVENDRITITSKNLISELKTFISSGVSFAAKYGETDDLVMALMLVVRMSQVLKNYYPELEQQISDRQDEIIKPMPFIAVF